MVENHYHDKIPHMVEEKMTACHKSMKNIAYQVELQIDYSIDIFVDLNSSFKLIIQPTYL